MRFFWPIAKVDAEQRMVWGYASTEALDEQGEIVRREALEAALGTYMRFANIREMHQPSAVGVAKEAAVDDRGLYLAAKIVDDVALELVIQGVYKGFSIGGRVTARDPTNRSIITGLALTEISVVDRPANPEAVFDCWKASGTDQMQDGFAPISSFEDAMRGWACGNSGHQHRNKDEADGCIINRAAAPDAVRWSYQAEGSKPAELAIEADPAIPARPYGIIETELSKVHGQGSALLKLVSELSVAVERMATQVNEIARTPLPAQTIAYPNGLTGIRKNEDSGRGRPSASEEDIVEHFAKLSPAEQTMLLIKAAYRNPIRFGGVDQAEWDAN
jgi:phage head maturation protease